LFYEQDITKRPYLAVILQVWSHVSHKCLEQQKGSLDLKHEVDVCTVYRVMCI